MKHIKNQTIKPEFNMFLAPVDGWTDFAFRQIIKKYSKIPLRAVFTEFVHVEAIIRNTINTKRILFFDDNADRVGGCETTEIAQLFGNEPESYKKSIPKVLEIGYMGVDINMGCSVDKIVKNGDGAALIKEPEKAVKIIQECKNAIDKYVTDKSLEYTPTLSVKTRLGFTDDISEEWIPLLADQELDWISIHGRVYSQGFKGKANWDQIGKINSLLNNTEKKVKIIGNGDLKSLEQVARYHKQYNLWGYMTARYAQLLLSDEKEGRLKILKEYLKLHQKYLAPFYKKPGFSYRTTRKVIAWFLSGMQSNKLTKCLMRAELYEEAFAVLESNSA